MQALRSGTAGSTVKSRETTAAGASVAVIPSVRHAEAMIWAGPLRRTGGSGKRRASSHG